MITGNIDNLSIEVDSTIGRTLVTKVDLQPGQLIWTEKAIIYADDSDQFDISQLNLLASAFNKTVNKKMSTILAELTELEKIECFDTAKNFILLLAIDILRRKDVNTLLSMLSTTQNVTIEQITQHLTLIHQLNGSHIEQYIPTASTILSTYPTLIPKYYTLEEICQLISILNTNQLEIDIGGSGLFPWTAILQHSCSPNCSFTTYQNQLYLVVITPITANTRLSIDYGNYYYHCTNDRIISLQGTYGFICNCSLCTGPDRKRGYKCRHCKTGIIFVIGTGNIENTDKSTQFADTGYVCTTCHTPMTMMIYQLCTAREQYYHTLIDKPLQILEEMKSEQLLHDTHYIRYWALDSTIQYYIDKGKQELYFHNTTQAIVYYQHAYSYMIELGKLLDFQLSIYHHEKVIFYDKFAQICVAMSDIVQAKHYWKIAYEHSCIVSGTCTPPTAAIQALYENTPTTMNALYEAYANQN